MTDKKLTDNEIVKALECCIDDTDNICQKCPIFKECVDGKIDINSLALDLINRLQAENERLQDAIDEQDIEIAQLYKRLDIAKTKAYKECIEKAKSEIDRQSHSRSLEASGERFRVHKILDNLLKELVGE